MKKELEHQISLLVKELAKEYGFTTEKSLELASDLTIAFIRSILSSKRRLSKVSHLLDGELEWMYIAYSVKRTPVCTSPCLISNDIEKVINDYGFRNLNYMIIFKSLCEGKD